MDTTAAGDSFCGGLLYILSTCDYFDSKTLEEAIQCGHWAARKRVFSILSVCVTEKKVIFFLGLVT